MKPIPNAIPSDIIEAFDFAAGVQTSPSTPGPTAATPPTATPTARSATPPTASRTTGSAPAPLFKIKSADEIVAEQAARSPGGDPEDDDFTDPRVPDGTPGSVIYAAEPEHAAYIERATAPAAQPVPPLSKPPPATPPPDAPVARIKTADEIVSEHLAMTGAAGPEDPGPPMFEPLPLPARRGASRAPQAPQHQTTARTEVVELRQEVAALRQEHAETARLLREIHERVVGEGR